MTHELTPRELEVLDLASQGNTDRRVASRLGVTKGTVRKHLQAAYLKLNAFDRAHAVRIAMGLGLFGAMGASVAFSDVQLGQPPPDSKDAPDAKPPD